MARRATRGKTSSDPKFKRTGTPAGFRRVAEFREVVGKVVVMLSERNITVSQQGTRAYVKYDTRTNLPRQVNLPYVPDDADEELLGAIKGFLDHEVAHVLFTDGDQQNDKRLYAKGPKPDQALFNIYNLLEDTRIERKMQERFPGTAGNLANVFNFMGQQFTKPELQEALANGDQSRVFSLLGMPLMRAWAGQNAAQQFMNEMDGWNLLAKEIAVLSPFQSRIASLDTTKDAMDLACDILARLKPPPQSGGGGGDFEEHDQSEEAGDEESQSNSKSGKDNKSDKDDASDGEKEQEKSTGKEQPQPEEQAPDKDQQQEADQSIVDKEGEPEEGPQDEADDGGEDEGAADEQGEQPAGEQPEQEGEGEPGDGDAADEDEGGDEGEQPEDGDKGDEGGDGDAPEEASPDSPGEDGPSAQPEEGGDGDSEQQGSQPGDGDEGEDSSAPSGSEDEDGGEDSEDVKITVGDMLDGISGEPRNDAANAISVAVQEGIRNDTYLPFTTDYDQWTDVVVDPAAIPAVDREIMSADEKMRQMVGQMQAQMRRMFAQQATSVNIGGMRSGRLNASSLHRLFAGDDRVFARREEHEAMDTAVELLIDCSGSMSGDKIKVACHAAYVLSQTLERLGIVHAIDGFTTHGDAPDQLWYDIRDEMTKLGRDFSRIEPIRIYRFKKFEERLTHPVKQRLIGAGGTGGGRYGGGSFHSQLQMASNIDGESFLRVGRELLKRREPRKIMMVLSDGYPAGAGVNIDLRDHLKFAVRELERLKVETVGIGICDDAVKAFYPKNTVIHSVDDLPKAVMGELKRFLIDNKQVV